MIDESSPEVKKLELPLPQWFAREISKFAVKGSPEYRALLRIAVAISKRDVSEAENMVAGTLARAIRYHHKFVRGTNMSAWLATILRNQNILNIRHASVENKNLQNISSVEIEDGEAGILGAVYARQRRELIARLPLEQQRIISALEKHGSFDTTAKELGLPEQSVKESLRNAVASLSEMEGEEAPKPSPLGERKSVETFLTQDDLSKLLPKLPKNQREAYITTAIEKKTVTEAAALLGVAEGTVKSRVSRARDKLAQLKGIATDRTTNADRLRQWYEGDQPGFEKAIKILAPSEWDVVRRVVILGQSTSEIAEETKLARGSIVNYLSSANKKMSDYLP